MAHKHSLEEGKMFSWEIPVFFSLFVLAGFGSRQFWHGLLPMQQFGFFIVILIVAYFSHALWMIYRENRGLYNPSLADQQELELRWESSLPSLPLLARCYFWQVRCSAYCSSAKLEKVESSSSRGDETYLGDKINVANN